MVARTRVPGELRSRLSQAWQDWSKGAAEVTDVRLLRTHYKPRERARLVIEVTLRSPQFPTGTGRQWVFLQLCPSFAQARRRHAYYSGRRALPSIGPPVFVVREWNAVGFTLPNGPRLRNLADFLDAGRFARILARKEKLSSLAEDFRPSGVELVRYVPRKRALLRYRPGDPPDPTQGLYVKLYALAQYPRALANMRRLRKAHRAGNLGFRPAVMLAKSRKRRAIFMEELPGAELTAVLSGAQEGVLEGVGEALAGLHGSTIRIRTKWRPQDELEALSRAAQDLCAAAPEAATPLQDVLARLQPSLNAMESFEPHPIHANLFGDQILVGEAGIAMVDWDDLSLGDPCFDLGRLAAHILFELRLQGADGRVADAAIEAILKGYERRLAAPCHEGRMAWHAAVALLMRVKISALRPLRTDWRSILAAALEEVTAMLESRSLLRSAR